MEFFVILGIVIGSSVVVIFFVLFVFVGVVLVCLCCVDLYLGLEMLFYGVWVGICKFVLFLLWKGGVFF